MKLQFSIKSILILITVCAVVLAVVTAYLRHRWEKEERWRIGKVLVMSAAEDDLAATEQILKKHPWTVEPEWDRYAGRSLGDAVLRGNIAMVKLLLDYGVPVAFDDWIGFESVLHAFVDDRRVGAQTHSTEDREMLTLLFERGADLDYVDRFGLAPLHLATERPAAQAVLKLLLEFGADPNVETRERKFTPLHLACWQHDVEMVKLLLAHGAEPKRRAADGRVPEDFLDTFDEILTFNYQADDEAIGYMGMFRRGGGSRGPGAKEKIVALLSVAEKQDASGGATVEAKSD